MLGEVKTFFISKDSCYMYLLPSLLVNFLANYLELCNIVTLCFEVSPTHYCTGDVVYLITFGKKLPGIPIDVVAVNYAIFAISI
jgi:hypothetical protein